MSCRHLFFYFIFCSSIFVLIQTLLALLLADSVCMRTLTLFANNIPCRVCIRTLTFLVNNIARSVCMTTLTLDIHANVYETFCVGGNDGKKARSVVKNLCFFTALKRLQSARTSVLSFLSFVTVKKWKKHCRGLGKVLYSIYGLSCDKLNVIHI